MSQLASQAQGTVWPLGQGSLHRFVLEDGVHKPGLNQVHPSQKSGELQNRMDLGKGLQLHLSQGDVIILTDSVCSVPWIFTASAYAEGASVRAPASDLTAARAPQGLSCEAALQLTDRLAMPSEARFLFQTTWFAWTEQTVLGRSQGRQCA